MTSANVVAGLAILDRYRAKPGGYDIGAEHDTIFAYPTTHPLSPDDVAKMKSLGWTQEDSPRLDNGDFEYFAGESWCAYV